MVKRLLWALGVVPPTVIFVALAVANRHAVRIILDPTSLSGSQLEIETPLFLPIFASMGAGLLLGEFATWIGQGKWHRRVKKLARETAHWRREAGHMNEQLETSTQARLPQPSNSD